MKSIPIMNGVECKDCFIHLGAGILAIIEYTSSGLAAQVKVEGGAGYRIDLSVINPKFSGSGVLAAPLAGKPVNYPLAYGMQLSLTPSTLNLAWKGDITFFGNASVTGGFDTYLKFGATYANTKVTPIKTVRNSFSPLRARANFKKVSMYFGVTVTGIMKIQLGYPYYGATIDSMISVSDKSVFLVLLFRSICLVL
jgi:hypothetical protein